MLYFTYKEDNSHAEQDVEWHVGEKPPRDFIEERVTVTSCVADGHELEYIERFFKNLPMARRNGRSCVWRGDLAAFIFDNLDERELPKGT